MATKIKQCRICKNTELTTVLDLGDQVLTGIFPKSKDDKITSGPLQLVKCSGNEETCGLLQLAHSYELDELYGENYGYRSGLNTSMVSHLRSKVEKILEFTELDDDDLVLDIGSNDGTTLKAYPNQNLSLVGIDPSGLKFKEFYPDHIDLIPDFFPSAQLESKYPGRKASVVTSFSMFYDLEDPFDFMKEVYNVLKDYGIWVFEQSYMPFMLSKNSYDTVCHEHLEYYALKQIKWMADRVGFSIVDIEFNDINGGSFSIVVQKVVDTVTHCSLVKSLLEKEAKQGLDGLKPYRQFEDRVKLGKDQLLELLTELKAQGKTVYGLGASTKGNVILQYCGITEDLLPFIGEVNEDKFGCYTPGTKIPILPEDLVLSKKPDYLFVLPWHFSKFFLANTKLSNMKLLFSIPEIQMIEVE